MDKYLELCSIYGLKYVAENMLRVIRFTPQVLFFNSEGRRVGIGRANSYLLMTFLQMWLTVYQLVTLMWLSIIYYIKHGVDKWVSSKVCRLISR